MNKTKTYKYANVKTATDSSSQEIATEEKIKIIYNIINNKNK